MRSPGNATLLWLLPCLALSVARAEILSWIDFDGQIEGGSVDKAHHGWIEIQSFNLAGPLVAGQAGSFSFIRQADRATPALVTACAKGNRYPKADLDLFRPDDKGTARLVRLGLLGVFVISNQTSTVPGGAPIETIGLAFEKITYSYFIPDAGTVFSNFDYRSLTGSSGTGTVADADGDGMPDAWETTYGFLLGSNDADADADGDGLSNVNEYQLGTHPTSGTSFFKADLAPVPGVPGTFQLTWNSVPGKTYIIEWSPDLNTPFATLRTVTATATATSENLVRSGAIGFFRVRPQS